MRLLPYDFTVKYVPRSQMGITDYLSRDPNSPAKEFVMAIIKELNVQKNANFLNKATEAYQKNALGFPKALQKKNVESKMQTERRQPDERPATHQRPNQPAPAENLPRIKSSM